MTNIYSLLFYLTSVHIPYKTVIVTYLQNSHVDSNTIYETENIMKDDINKLKPVDNLGKREYREED